MTIAGASIIIVIVASAIFIPGLNSRGTKGANSASISNSGKTTTSSQSTCAATANGTVTVTAGQFPPCGCVLVDSNSNGSLYVSTNPKVGDNVCVTASLNDSPQVYLSITNAAVSVVFSGTCVAVQQTGAPPPTGDTCTAYWNTANPDPHGDPIKAGTYLLVASDSEGAAPALEANFTLS